MLHLVHPALVHFSVAFLVFGAIAEAGGLLARREALARWGGQLVLVGCVSLVPTIVSGSPETTNPGRGGVDATVASLPRANVMLCCAACRRLVTASKLTMPRVGGSVKIITHGCAL